MADIYYAVISFSSASADKSEGVIGGFIPFAYSDYWVVKLDSLGNKTWDNTFGSVWTDALYSIQQTVDGGYILGGSSDNVYNPDYWAVELDEAGNIVWENKIDGRI